MTSWQIGNGVWTPTRPDETPPPGAVPITPTPSPSPSPPSNGGSSGGSDGGGSSQPIRRSGLNGTEISYDNGKTWRPDYFTPSNGGSSGGIPTKNPTPTQAAPPTPVQSVDLTLKQKMEAAQLKTFNTTGGYYTTSTGQGFSSMKTPEQFGTSIKSFGQPSLWPQTNQANPLINAVAKNQPIITPNTKIGNVGDTSFESNRQQLVTAAKTNYLQQLQTPVQKVELNQAQLDKLNTNLNTPTNSKQLLALQKNPIDIFNLSREKGASALEQQQKFINNQFANGSNLEKLLIKPIALGAGLVYGGGTFINSLAGEAGRNIALMEAARFSANIEAGKNPIKESYAIDVTMPGSFVSPGLISQEAILGEVALNRGINKQFATDIENKGYAIGRLTPKLAYFTPAAPIIAVTDIAGAKNVGEVVLPALVVGGTSLGLVGALNVAEYVPYKVASLLGTGMEATIPKTLEYGYYASKYALPGIMAGYGAYSVSQAFPYLSSSDYGVRSEAERQFDVSMGAGYVGGAVGVYLGENLSRPIQKSIIKLKTEVGAGAQGKLSDVDLQKFEEEYKRAFNNELPQDVQEYMPLKEYTSKNLKAWDNLDKITSSDKAKLIKITDETVNEYADRLYIGGSSQIPSQIEGPAFKKSGDIDIFMGPKGFTDTLAERINAAGIKGVTATVNSEGELFGIPTVGGGSHVGLQYNGKPISEEFVNLHYDLSMTQGQLNKFGDVFESPTDAFITSEKSGLKLFNLREQLRAKVYGYYISGRAKDIVDLEGIMAGTQNISKAYKQDVANSVWGDERVSINLSSLSASTPKISIGSNKVFDYVPTQSMQVPKVSISLTNEYTPSIKVGVPSVSISNYTPNKSINVGNYFTKEIKVASPTIGYSNYSTPSIAYSLTAYTTKAGYTPSYNQNYSNYTPKVSLGYTKPSYDKYSGYTPTTYNPYSNYDLTKYNNYNYSKYPGYSYPKPTGYDYSKYNLYNYSGYAPYNYSKYDYNKYNYNKYNYNKYNYNKYNYTPQKYPNIDKKVFNPNNKSKQPSFSTNKYSDIGKFKLGSERVSLKQQTRTPKVSMSMSGGRMPRVSYGGSNKYADKLTFNDSKAMNNRTNLIAKISDDFRIINKFSKASKYSDSFNRAKSTFKGMFKEKNKYTYANDYSVRMKGYSEKVRYRDTDLFNKKEIL